MNEKDLLEEDDETTVNRILQMDAPKMLLSLKDKVIFDEEKLSLMHPKDIMYEIDQAIKVVGNYSTKRRRKLSSKSWAEMWTEIDIEYGSFSAAVNRVIREKLKDTAKRSTEDKGEAKKKTLKLHNLYSWLNAYWWNRTHWVQKVFKSKSGLGGLSSKRAMKQGADTLAKLIEGKVNPAKVHPEFHKIIQNLKMATADSKVTNTLDKM